MKKDDKSRVNLRTYSISSYKDVVRPALKSFTLRVFQLLTERDHKVIENKVKMYPLQSQEEVRQYLKHVAETVFYADILGLDKGDAIDRLRVWVGDRLMKDWRLDANS